MFNQEHNWKISWYGKWLVAALKENDPATVHIGCKWRRVNWFSVIDSFKSHRNKTGNSVAFLECTEKPHHCDFFFFWKSYQYSNIDFILSKWIIYLFSDKGFHAVARLILLQQTLQLCKHITYAHVWAVLTGVCLPLCVGGSLCLAPSNTIKLCVRCEEGLFSPLSVCKEDL